MKKVWAVIAAIAVFGVTAVAAAPAGAAKNTRFFQSPTKNIGCVMLRGGPGIGPGEARCDIRHHDWMAPPKPASCHLDYGNGLVVGEHGKGQFVCAGDTTLGQGPVLPYGGAIEFGGFRCKSAVGGVRCVNRKTQHGFKLSRRVARVF